VPQGGGGCATPDTSADQLWTRFGPGWTGGDGTYSVGLPDGRSVWLFGDTFLGTINSDGSRSMSTPFVHNSLVVQNGQDLSDVNFLTPAAAATPSAPGDWFWPGSGTVSGDTLKVLELEFGSTGSGIWAFTYKGTSVATFALPRLSLVSVKPVTTDPGIDWGSGTLDDGGFTYIYGAEDTDSGKYVHVARVPQGDLTAPWQYYDGSTWSTDPSASARILGGVSNQFSVVAVAGHYELISQDDDFSPDVSAYSAASPVGPFANKTVIYTTPNWGPGTFTHNALAHPERGWAGGLLVSYNVNELTALGDYTNALIYRPHFVRVPASCLPN
jgi:Domain of unknown function (DUF5005)